LFSIYIHINKAEPKKQVSRSDKSEIHLIDWLILLSPRFIRNKINRSL